MARPKQQKITKEQALEIIKCSEDYIHCIETYMKIVHPIKGEVPFKLWDFQKDIIRQYDDPSIRHVVLLMPRQQSKTSTTAAYLLCEAIFKNTQTILITSNKLSGAVEVLDRIKNFYKSMPSWLVPKIAVNNRASLHFNNQSKIVCRATTADAGRGLSISTLYADEIAFVPPERSDAFFSSIYPVVSTGGRFFASSTPAGDTGLFYRLWRDAYILKTGAFHPIYVPLEAHPERDEEWAKETRKEIGDDAKYEQEFLCSFLSNAATLIDLKLLDHLKTLTLPPLEFVPNALSNPNWEVFKPRIQDVEYFITVDSSEGGGNDNSVINVFDDKLEQVAQYVDNYTDEDALAELIYKASQYYNEAMIYVEAESTGKAVLSLLERTYDIGELLARTKPSAKPGFRMTQSRRNTGISAMRQNIKHGRIKLNSTKTLDEFRFFKRKPGSAKYEAEYGTHDDMIMSIVLLCSELDRLADGNDKIHETLYELNEGDEDYTNKEATDYEPVAPISSNNTNPLEQEFEWV